MHINLFLFINHLCNAPFWHSKLINVLVKPKSRKLDGNLQNFIASHPFSAYLFFLKHPVWNLCECCLFLNSSFMNHSPPATAREAIWLWCRQVSIHFLLKLHDVFFCGGQIIMSCPCGCLSSLYSYGRIQLLANMLPCFHSVPSPVARIHDRDWLKPLLLF